MLIRDLQQTTEFLLVHPSRIATMSVLSRSHPEVYFYSHASCGARLVSNDTDSVSAMYFYSHAPYGAQRTGGTSFLLTRLLRGVTKWYFAIEQDVANFYSHVPRGARRSRPAFSFLKIFLLMHPLRGSTSGKNFFIIKRNISTHISLTMCNNSL